MSETILWTGFSVALLVAFTTLAMTAPVWVSSTAVAAAFLFGLPAALVAIRRKWFGG